MEKTGRPDKLWSGAKTTAECSTTQLLFPKARSEKLSMAGLLTYLRKNRLPIRFEQTVAF